ncbi:hypothetical protein K2173_003042 [Erythroxylum novogranatense]|uniref:Uncharacterized protein n=1 Tax=Erythroxylum novogranatense TaxID=1862640 RepID=A0AAV8S8B5_9ROSI|nr:hypothetical protein K2173_003042 [Erythroxylum novogranatense]
MESVSNLYSYSKKLEREAFALVKAGGTGESKTIHLFGPLVNPEEPAFHAFDSSPKNLRANKPFSSKSAIGDFYGFSFSKLPDGPQSQFNPLFIVFDLAPLQYLAPYSGCAMGEYFCDNGLTPALLGLAFFENSKKYAFKERR